MTEKVTFDCAAKIEPKPKRWLWRDWIPTNALTVLAGEAGSGKSTISMEIAAAVTRGGALPDGSATELGTVLIYATEDNIADTIIPRLLAAGADLSRVLFPAVTKLQKGTFVFNPLSDIGVLESTLAHFPTGYPPPRLLIVDPLISATGQSGLVGVRKALEGLVHLADRHNLAVIGITHFAKNSSRKTLQERVVGSLSYVAVARMVLAATLLPTGGYALGKVKTNIATLEGWIRYSVEDATVRHGGQDIETSRIEWGQIEPGSLADQFDPVAFNEPDGAIDIACSFLKAFLRDGPRTFNDITAVAETLPFSISTLRRAKRELKIKVRRAGDHWWWMLPVYPAQHQPTSSENAEHLGHLGLLGGSTATAI